MTCVFFFCMFSSPSINISSFVFMEMLRFINSGTKLVFMWMIRFVSCFLLTPRYKWIVFNAFCVFYKIWKGLHQFSGLQKHHSV